MHDGGRKHKPNLPVPIDIRKKNNNKHSPNIINAVAGQNESLQEPVSKLSSFVDLIALRYLAVSDKTEPILDPDFQDNCL